MKDSNTKIQRMTLAATLRLSNYQWSNHKMVKLIKVSDGFQQYVDDLCKKLKLKSREETTDVILKTLQQPQPIASDVPMEKPTEQPSKPSQKWTEKEARRIKLSYQIYLAKQKAQTEGLREREHIKTEAQAQRRGQSQRKSEIDMGDSAGVPEEYIF